MKKQYVTAVMLVGIMMLSAGCASTQNTSLDVSSPNGVSTAHVEMTEAVVHPTEAVISFTEKFAEPTVIEVTMSRADAPRVLATAKTTKEDKVMYATASVNIRSEASADSKKLGTLKSNDEVKVTGSVDGWKRIDFNGVTAFVSAKYLSDTKVAVSKPSKPSTSKSTAGSSEKSKTNSSSGSSKGNEQQSGSFDGDFAVDDTTPEEAKQQVEQAYKDAGWFDEDGNRIEGGNWTQ